MTRGGKPALLCCALSLIAVCAPGEKTAVAPAAPPPLDWDARIAAADALYAGGHYAALKDARDIYDEALAVPECRAAVSEKFVRAAVALDLREKELGILPGKPARDLAAFVAADPALAAYASWLELLSGLPDQIKGSPGIEQTGGGAPRNPPPPAGGPGPGPRQQTARR